MNDLITPKWAKEIDRFLTVKPQFALWGNIYDVYPININGSATTLKMLVYLKTLLTADGYSLILSYEPLTGIKLLEGSPELFKTITEENIDKNNPLKCTPLRLADTLDRLVCSNKAYSAVIISYASRIADIAGNDVNEFYYRMFTLMHNSTALITSAGQQPKYNLIVWLIDKENDLPAWYTLDNPKIKILSVPKPDFSLRKTVVENLSKYINGFNDADDKHKTENINLFIDQTNGLYASEIVSIVSLAKREGVDFLDIGDAIRMYKLGIIENPWSKLDMVKINKAQELLSVKVKGQDRAIIKAADVIKRAVYNLSGAQFSKHSQKPKGVLFFAGPTGVGKTELAKALTELLFGSQTSYIRFDMSEFSTEHANQRLIGAPPGYVGYDVGGELTNAVKQNPFSVILFDEIEKAHPRLLDIFLQILDDGRLTSGRGETAYFTESLIIFTSNLGIYELTPSGEKIQNVSQDMPYEEINDTIKQAIDSFFKYKLGRPEILNRIGDNIIVFDFIRGDIAAKIFDKMLLNVVEKMTDSYDINIELTEDAITKLGEICCQDLSMGGRGIGNKMAEALINPLSRALFAIDAKRNERFLINGIAQDEQTWNIIIKRQST
ncbi:ATPase AAA-2 domain-containing protein [Candidatus Magnetoovum chiemensis]|nr:ATPase AAA-2 domain-containing protein [Candidatus Magnetoovum chiemensis]